MTPREQVLAELDRQCRKAEQSPHFDEWYKNEPVRKGPLTPNLSKALGWSPARVRRHLDAEVAAGRVLRHKSYAGCMVRWWINTTPPES